jgi:hypothetical protein|tara:strand:- start:938 stop:1438 length:501 start_codon:yes stop_codon:yes gene_type:complete
MIDRGRGVDDVVGARRQSEPSPRALSMTTTTTTTTVRAVGRARAMSTSVSSRRAVETVIRRATANGDEREREASASASASASEVKLDPFGFGARRRDEPDEIVPGFDTAEGGKVGPVGTVAISTLLVALFGGSFFFTSVPRDAVTEMAARDLADDPNAPTQSFKRV